MVRHPDSCAGTMTSGSTNRSSADTGSKLGRPFRGSMLHSGPMPAGSMHRVRCDGPAEAGTSEQAAMAPGMATGHQVC
jgi:hypothetical protein